MKISTGLAAVLCLLQLLPLSNAAGNDWGVPNINSAAGDSEPTQGYMRQPANYQQGDAFGRVPRFAGQHEPQGVLHGYPVYSTSHEPYGQTDAEQHPNMFDMRSMNVALGQQDRRTANPSDMRYQDGSRSYYGGLSTLGPISVKRDPHEAFASMTQPYRGGYGGRKPARYDSGGAQTYTVLDTSNLAQETATLPYPTELDSTVGHRSRRSRNKSKEQLTVSSRARGWEHQNDPHDRGTSFLPGRSFKVESDHDHFSRLGMGRSAHTDAEAIEAEPVSSVHAPTAYKDALAYWKNRGRHPEENVEKAEEVLSTMMQSHYKIYQDRDWPAQTRYNRVPRVLDRIGAVHTAMRFVEKDPDYQSVMKAAQSSKYHDPATLRAKGERTLTKLKNELGLHNAAMSLLAASQGYLDAGQHSKALQGLKELSDKLSAAFAAVDLVLRSYKH